MMLGDLIKQKRKELKISQRELAKRLNIPYSTLANYENNHREPNIQMLTSIAHALDVPTTELIPSSTSEYTLLDKNAATALQAILNNSDPYRDIRQKALERDINDIVGKFDKELDSFNQNLKEYVELDDLEFFTIFLEKFKIDTSNIDKVALEDLKEKVVSYASFLISTHQLKEGE